jgi:hypothetical protein
MTITNDFYLMWIGFALLNLLAFLKIDWGIIKKGWDLKTWFLTMVCCLFPPLGWIMLTIVYLQWKPENK